MAGRGTYNHGYECAVHNDAEGVQEMDFRVRCWCSKIRTAVITVVGELVSYDNDLVCTGLMGINLIRL